MAAADVGRSVVSATEYIKQTGHMAICLLNDQMTTLKAYLEKKYVFAVLPIGFFAFEHKFMFKSVQFITGSVLDIGYPWWSKTQIK